MVQAVKSLPFKVASFQFTRTFFTVVSSQGHAFAWGRNDFLEVGFKKSEQLLKMRPIHLQDPTAKKSPAGSGLSQGRSQEQPDPSQSRSQTNFHWTDKLGSPGSTRQGTWNAPHGLPQEDSEDLAVSAVCSVLSEHVTFYVTSKGLYLAGRRTSNLAPCEKLLKRKREVFDYPYKIPVAVAAPLTVVGLSAANSHALAWDGAGNLFGWGVNLFGCLGIEANQARNSEQVSVPERVAAMHNAKVVSCLALPEVSLAITHQGRLFTWGRWTRLTQVPPQPKNLPRALRRKKNRLQPALRRPAGPREGLRPGRPVHGSGPRRQDLRLRQHVAYVHLRNKETLGRLAQAGLQDPLKLTLVEPFSSQFFAVDLDVTERNACVIAVDRTDHPAVNRAKKAATHQSFVRKAREFLGSNVASVREDFKIKNSFSTKSYRQQLSKALDEASKTVGETGKAQRSSVCSQAPGRGSVLNSPKRLGAPPEPHLQDSFIGIHPSRDLSADLKDLRIGSDLSQRILKEGLLTEDNWRKTLGDFRKTGELSSGP